MLVTSQTNRSACEICGTAPADRYVRSQEARRARCNYARTRTNRIRVDATLWDVEWIRKRLDGAGIHRAEWGGKLVCGPCQGRISRLLNAD